MLFKIDTNSIRDETNKKERFAVQSIKNFIDNKNQENKIIALYGLRRTGNTTIATQIIQAYKNIYKTAFYMIANKEDKMDDIYSKLKEEKENGTELIYIEEITKAKDFIENSNALADIFAKNGMKIIICGYELLNLYLAKNTSLKNKIFLIKTTYISYAEHNKIFQTNDIYDYIKYGGVISKSAIYDYEKYIIVAIVNNILKYKNCNNIIKNMYAEKLKMFMIKMLEAYSGIIDKEKIIKELKNNNLNPQLHFLHETKYKNFTKSIRKNLSKSLMKIIDIKTKSAYNIIIILEKYLRKMDVLSTITKISFDYNNNLKKEKIKRKNEFYITQPALKYNLLKENLNFLDKNSFFLENTYSIGQKIKEKLCEKIKNNILKQIIVFEVNKTINFQEHKAKYEVFSLNFTINKAEIYKYDLIVYDKEKNTHWAFKVITKESQNKYLQNKKIKNTMNKYFGKTNKIIILHNNKSFVDKEIYFNISDFLIAINKYKNIEIAINKIIENLNTK